jgi:hypothetical protein
MLRVRVYPLKDFAIALARGEFFAQCHGVNAEKIDDVLIKRTVVIVLAVATGDGGATFVEHSR